VNNYFYCHIPLEGLLCDVERELLARAKFFVMTSCVSEKQLVIALALRWMYRLHIIGLIYACKSFVLT